MGRKIENPVGVKYLFNNVEKELAKEDKRRKRQQREAEEQREKESKAQKKIDATIKEDQEFQQRMEKIDRVAKEKIAKLKTNRKSYQKSVDKIIADAEKRKLQWRDKKSKREEKQVREEGKRKTIKQTRKKINIMIKESAHYTKTRLIA